LDVPFFRTHNLVSDSPIRAVAAFMATGFEKVSGRLHRFPPMHELGAATPEGAVLLSHETLLILGTDRNWVTDLSQSLISYGHLRSPRAIHDMLTEIGVTHLAWQNRSYGYDSLAGDLAFLNYAVGYTIEQKAVANFTVARLPDTPPEDEGKDWVVGVYGCRRPLATGLYPFEALTDSRHPPPPSRQKLTTPETQADFLIVERACHASRTIPSMFRLVTTRGKTELFLRTDERP
jgi:hypothetical protein